MQNLVSVIIPVYNMEKFVRQCVDSVISQSYSNIEIILVNDGSTDSSLLVCEDLVKKYSNCFLVNQENKGVSEARNHGIEKANGKYIFFLDADDSLPQDAIQNLVKASITSNSDMVIGNHNANSNIQTEVFEGEDYLVKALEDNPITYHVWGILYSRDLIKNLKFPKGYIAHEDSYFIFLCALKKPKVTTINALVYNYNSTNFNSASRTSFSEKKYNDICDLLSLKEEEITANYSHLLPLFYHLKTKIQMALLMNLCLTNGKKFRQMEKETLERFYKVKCYFRRDLPSANVRLYNILSFKMYYLYKCLQKIKGIAKRVLRKY